MSEKKRQKKDGRDKNKKNQAMKKHQPPKSLTGKDKDRPAEYGEGLAGTEVKSKPGVRGIV